MVQNVPRGGPFRDVFGAHLLPRVLAEMIAGLHPGFSLRLLTLAAFAALVSVMGVWLFYLTRWREFRNAVTCLPKSEKVFSSGAALVAGCFSAGSNIGYLLPKDLQIGCRTTTLRPASSVNDVLLDRVIRLRKRRLLERCFGEATLPAVKSRLIIRIQ